MTTDLQLHNNSLTTTATNTLPIIQQASSNSQQLQAMVDATRFERFNKKKSPNTLKAYRRDLQKFGRAWLGDNCPKHFGQDMTTDPTLWQYVTHGEVTTFILWLKTQGYALSTINRALYAMRSYAKLAMLSGAMGHEQYAKIAGIEGDTGKQAHNIDDQRPVTRRDQLDSVDTVKKADPTRIPEDIVHSLLHDHELYSMKGLRNAVVFNILLQLGLRASELSDLKWSDIDLERGEVSFYRRKVGKQQTMGLSASLQALLRKYTAQFPTPDSADGKLLYGVTRTDKVGKNGMSAANISMHVKQVGNDMGLPALSAHDLRHHWTTTLHNKGVDNLTLQRMGGWNSPAMLQRYVAEKTRVNEGIEDPYK